MRRPDREKWITLLYLVIAIFCLFLIAYVIESNPRVSEPVEYLLSSEVGASSAPAASETPSSLAEAPAALVNLNTATLDELCTLDGIGPVLAQRILDHRTDLGGFGSIEEIMEVSGIAEKKFEAIRSYITVE